MQEFLQKIERGGNSEKRCVSGCGYVVNPCLSKEDWKLGLTHTPAANRAWLLLPPRADFFFFLLQSSSWLLC